MGHKTRVNKTEDGAGAGGRINEYSLEFIWLIIPDTVALCKLEYPSDFLSELIFLIMTCLGRRERKVMVQDSFEHQNKKKEGRLEVDF
ncbi:MAG TPA: hypothetical protein VKA95_04120 [Nitrososphaeraceae archaeon]|nr:hypothetical protein [Nitrososphaeraceae archaeon]